MKLFVLTILMLISCARGTFGFSPYSGDINIESKDKNGNFNCDGLICPENTHSCEVTKRNDPEDFQQIVRKRRCLSADGKVLKNDEVKEPNLSGATMNAHAFAYANFEGQDLNAEEMQRTYGQFPTYMPSNFGGMWYP